MVGYTQSKEELQARLRRVEGQVRGLQRLVDEDTYCIDVLTQISAVNAALRKVAVALLDDHLRHCVRDAASDDAPRARSRRCPGCTRRGSTWTPAP